MDNTNTNLSQPGVQPVEWYENKDNKDIVQARSYTTAEKIAAWLLVPLGYLFLRAGLANPLGLMLVLWGLFALTAVLLAKRGRFRGRFGGARWLGTAALLSTVPGSLVLFFSANTMVHAGAVLYCLLAWAYGVYALTENTLEDGLSDYILVELFRAGFLYPCLSLGEMPKAMGLGKGWKQAGKVLLRLIGGVSLTIIPTLAVYILLRYDSSFRDTMAQIRANPAIFDHIRDLILGSVLALAAFALYATATGGRRDVITLEGCRRASDKVHVFSPVTSWAATLPVLCLYAVFFFSQWDNYVSAFTGVLPDSFSYAAYAREGFFELCAVAVINLCFLCATGLFTAGKAEAGKGRTASPAIRVLHGVLAVCTLILIATAMSKLVLYINAYGLTRKRVYAAWLMALLALVFVLVIVKQFCPRLKLVALAVAAVAVFWLGLGLADVEGRIADYNVDRYLTGSLETPEGRDLYWELTELGDSAIPAKVRAIRGGLCEDANGDMDTNVRERDIWEMTLPCIRAREALEK